MNITQSFPRETMAHDYSDLFSALEARILADADNAITTCELWDWFREYTPDENIVKSKHPNINRIYDAMNCGDYSGYSIFWAMSQMKYVAEMGWEEYRSGALRRKAIREEEVRRRLARGMSEEPTLAERNAIDRWVRKIGWTQCPCRKANGLEGWCGIIDPTIVTSAPPCWYEYEH